MFNGHGDFVEFSTNIHEHAKQYGYWRFASDSRNDVQAYIAGFQNPEQLFSTYNNGVRGTWHVEIKLTWYAGETDPYQKRRTGTTGQHMANIAEERKLLGLPPFLATQVPVRDIELRKYSTRSKVWVQCVTPG